MYYKADADVPDYADARQYLSSGYNLAHHFTYSQHLSVGQPGPGIGREPAFPVLIAILIHADPDGLGQVTKSCLSSKSHCEPKLYASIQLLNRLLFALAGVCLFFTGLSIFSSLGAAVVCGSGVWLNMQMQKNMDYVVSDPLALLLACALALTIVRFHRSPHKIIPACLAGAILGILILTKAVYLYFLYLVICTVVVLMVFPTTRGHLNTIKLPVILFVILASLGPTLWMSRNAEVSGNFVLTDNRGGIALSTREVFNHMTPMQYAASFVYWTRGFGDSLAAKTFPEEHWRPFDILEPGGFYDRGQNGYGKRVATIVQASGVSESEARSIVDSQLRRAIISKPVTHLLTTVPLLYRGIWIDLFAWITVPALIVLIYQSIRRCDTLMLLVLTPSVFNLLFYALFSLNIPRYQMTAAPAFALALAMVSVWTSRRWKKWRQASHG